MPAPAERPSRRTLIAIGLYLLWCAVAYAVLLSTDWRYAWHALLYALAALVIWKPALLRPRKARPTATHFLFVGTVLSAFVAEPLAVLGQGDLHPNLLVNGFLWIGCFAGIYLAWWWLLPRWRWSPFTVFLLCGAVALFDDSLVLWRLLLADDVSSLLLTLPVLHAVYACMTAPVVLAYRTVLAEKSESPGPLGIAAAALAPGLLFRVGSLWILFGRLFLQQ